MEDDFWVMPEPEKVPLSAEARRRRKRIAVFVVLAVVLIAYPVADYIIINPSPMPFLRLKLMGVSRVEIGWSQSGRGKTTVLSGASAREFVRAIDAERGICSPAGCGIYGIRFYKGQREVALMWLEDWSTLNWGKTRWASGMYLTRESTLRIRRVFERHGIDIKCWDEPGFSPNFLRVPE